MAVSSLALGWNSKVIIDSVSNDGTFAPTPTTLGGWVSGSLTFRRTNPDSTNIDTAGYEGKEYGIKGLSLSLEILDDNANDTGMDGLIDDFYAGTKRWIRVQPRVGTGYREFDFQAVINNAAWTLEQNGIIRFSFAADSNGAFTEDDQA